MHLNVIITIIHSQFTAKTLILIRTEFCTVIFSRKQQNVYVDWKPFKSYLSFQFHPFRIYYSPEYNTYSFISAYNSFSIP